MRLHVASLLMAAGRHDEALGHAATGLSTEPANVELLSIAYEAAAHTGRAQEAQGYRSLLDALAASAPDTAAIAPADGECPDRQVGR